MADIYPFRGYRYFPAAGHPDQLVTQPYDKISPQLQQDYYARSPYNMVRIIKSLEKNENPVTEYPQAQRLVRQWFDSEILVRDKTSALYVYTQEFEIDGETHTRRSFIGLLQLDEAGAGVRAHEKTLDEPKQDRLRLVRSIEANDELIFMLYDDPGLEVDRTLAPDSAPLVEARDDFGAVHRIFAVAEPDRIAHVRRFLLERTLYIADGHHRFETSLNYLRECRARGWKPAAVESFDKRLVACVALQDPGLKILPTHRLVRNIDGFSAEEFLRQAAEHFDVAHLASRSELFAAMRRAGQTVIGFYAGGGRFYALGLKDDAATGRYLPAVSDAYRRLDVVVLHVLLLDRLLGIDDARLAAQTNVEYARDRSGALDRVDAGNYQMAFLLNSTQVRQVHDVASAGEKMPQKSTDFYPKMITGLVLSRMEIDK